jgi:hypothetical protein
MGSYITTRKESVMSKFGKITKTTYKRHVDYIPKEVRVKSWRARVAEWLLGNDIEYLEDHLEREADKKIKEEASRLLKVWWENYKYALDDEILQIFPDYEPYIATLEANKNHAGHIVELTAYKQVRINGNYVAILPRFKKRLTTKGKRDE